jgi:hypothetical protein
MAQLTGSFVLEPDVVTFLGTWRFGVDSPKYGRQVMTSIIHDEQDHLRAQHFVKDSYPTFDAKPVVVLIPEPSHEQARLFEVMPIQTIQDISVATGGKRYSCHAYAHT